jgi:TM2 domain-containing membrane protein YozV
MPTVHLRADEPLKETVGMARLACGLLAILGLFTGLHKFAMGRITEGVIIWVAIFLSCFLLFPVFWVISVIEGIIYLVMDDQTFYDRYIAGERNWF